MCRQNVHTTRGLVETATPNLGIRGRPAEAPLERVAITRDGAAAEQRSQPDGESVGVHLTASAVLNAEFCDARTVRFGTSSTAESRASEHVGASRRARAAVRVYRSNTQAEPGYGAVFGVCDY